MPSALPLGRPAFRARWPILLNTLFNAAGQVLETNDNWAAGSNADQIAADKDWRQTIPPKPSLRTTLAPGAYTVVVSGKDPTPGIGLGGNL